MRLSGLFPAQGLIILWKFLKKGEVESCKAQFFIDSNAHLFGMVDLVSTLYPGLKILHIVRDPRTYVRSHLNWARHRPQSFVANYLIPFWQPNPFLLKEMSLRRWLLLSLFEKFCWVWDFKNRYIETLANSEIPYLMVRFEDLFSGPDAEAHLNQVFRFIGLPEVTGVLDRFKQPLNVTEKRSFPSWQDWEPERCARLEELCRQMMDHYGYGQEPEWMKKVRDHI